MTIKEVNNINNFESYSYRELKEIYNGSNGNNIINEAFELFQSFNNLGTCHNQKKLIQQIELYENAIAVFSKMCHYFHKIYVVECVPSQKDEQRSYVEASQIILSRLQNQYNQLVYRQQRAIAYIALAITVIFSIISIILSLIPLIKQAEEYKVIFYLSSNCMIS